MATSSISSPAAQPIQRFAHFFKGYNVGLSLVVAAIPILISVWEVVPLYAHNKNYIALITSISSYLLVGFIFSQRVSIGRLYFPRVGEGRAAYVRDIRSGQGLRGCPLGLLLISVFSFYIYFGLLNSSIEHVAYEYASSGGSGDARICDAQSLSPGQQRMVAADFVAFGKNASVTVYCTRPAASDKNPTPLASYSGIGFPDQDVVQTILANTPSPSIPYSFWASIFFLVAFLSATAAFILMGLKEYLQDELGLKDKDLVSMGMNVIMRFSLEVPGLYGEVEFSRVDPT